MGLYRYSFVKGFFIQDDSASVWPPVPERFGLEDSSPDRWSTFFGKLKTLNDEAPMGTKYRLIMFARHGQGWHNVAQSKYGTRDWDEHWSKLNGDGQLIWGPDPELTLLGEDQARTAAKVWMDERALPDPIPLPSKFYSSPFTRALNTCQITFEHIVENTQWSVEVVEDCREENGVHTCDKRRTKSYIEERFGGSGFFTEPGFAEEDELWDPEHRETPVHMENRAGSILDRIFKCEDDTVSFVSITAHGGIINAFLRRLGRPNVQLGTGGVLPVVVKAVALEQN